MVYRPIHQYALEEFARQLHARDRAVQNFLWLFSCALVKAILSVALWLYCAYVTTRWVLRCTSDDWTSPKTPFMACIPLSPFQNRKIQFSIPLDCPTFGARFRPYFVARGTCLCFPGLVVTFPPLSKNFGGGFVTVWASGIFARPRTFFPNIYSSCLCCRCSLPNLSSMLYLYQAHRRGDFG